MEDLLKDSKVVYLRINHRYRIIQVSYHRRRSQCLIKQLSTSQFLWHLLILFKVRALEMAFQMVENGDTSRSSQ